MSPWSFKTKNRDGKSYSDPAILEEVKSTVISDPYSLNPGPVPGCFAESGPGSKLLIIRIQTVAESGSDSERD
jgi:hypothetical protein